MPQKPRDNGPPPEVREKQNGRVRKLRQAARAALKDGEVYARRTSRGEIHIQGLIFKEDVATGLEYVEILMDGETEGEDPHFRIFNPPTLVSDPYGDVEIHGARYREDPLEALAEVLAMYGGARPERRKRVIR